MRPRLSVQLIALTVLVIATNLRNASSSSSIERLLSRRQSGEGEQESTTTPKSQDVGAAPAQATGGQDNGGGRPAAPPSRLYPDLPQQPNFLPPFGASPINGFRPAPMVPFGMQVPQGNRLNANQQQSGPFGRMPMQPRQLTPAERLQSQSFADGLGRRLLSMIGIDTTDQSKPENSNTGATIDQGSQQPGGGSNPLDSTMKALQNSTVLQQLNRGVNSIYSGLSRMYNSTVQEQLNMLQERFRAETANSTNPWHQRVAQQVPMFFKQMAGKVAEAQEQLNSVWQDIAQASANINGSTVTSRSDGAIPGSQSRSFFAPIDQFMNNQNDGSFFGQTAPGNDFFSQFGRSLGFTGNNATPNQQQAGIIPTNPNDLGARLRDMWHNQIQPQIGIVRSQMARVWRDLTASGALTPDMMFRSRVNNNNLGSRSNASSSDLVDGILKEIDISSNSEFSLIEPKSDGDQGESAAPAPASSSTGNAARNSAEPAIKLSPQMQNRLVEMQRELNQLWMGLTSSLQGALTNVRQTLNPRQQFVMPNSIASASTNGQQDVSPAQNEIDDKIKGLTKLQRDVDMVHDAVQQQQQQHEAQQHHTLGDRFRGLFNNVDMNGVNQLSDRVGNSFNRFGNAVGNFWNQIPNRWDDFITNARSHSQQQQQQQVDTQAKLKAPSASASATS